MANISLLDKSEYAIRKWISIKIPTLGEYRNSIDISSLVDLFTTTPSAHMVELEDMGIDFTEVDDYAFFISLFYASFVADRSEVGGEYVDSTLLFNAVQLSDCTIIEKNEEAVIVDKDGNIVIDEMIYKQISSALCEIFNVQKYKRKPGNETAKKYILQRERDKAKRRRKHKEAFNPIDGEIVALVCYPGFPYNFESINDLTIYNFYACVKQITKKDQYDKIMTGAYAGFGTVDLKKIPSERLNWLVWK